MKSKGRTGVGNHILQLKPTLLPVFISTLEQPHTFMYILFIFVFVLQQQH
jgi:hypothetical protein